MTAAAGVDRPPLHRIVTMRETDKPAIWSSQVTTVVMTGYTQVRPRRLQDHRPVRRLDG
jgi:hypothetical protein